MNELIRVEPIALFPSKSGCAVFLGDGAKVIVFYIEPGIGVSINSALSETSSPRPLTHDLFTQTLLAFGGRVTKVVIVRVKGEVFYARLWVEAENEIMSKKIIEIDARPSDAIAMAVRSNAPIYALKQVWVHLPDMSDVLNEMRKSGENP